MLTSFLFTCFLFSFVIFYVFLYWIIWILWPGPRVWWVNLSWLAFYSLSYRFVILTRIESSLFVFCFFTQFYPLVFNGLIIDLHCLSIFTKLFLFPKLSLLLFFFNLVYLLSLSIFHDLIKIKGKKWEWFD